MLMTNPPPKKKIFSYKHIKGRKVLNKASKNLNNMLKKKNKYINCIFHFQNSALW